MKDILPRSGFIVRTIKAVESQFSVRFVLLNEIESLDSTEFVPSSRILTTEELEATIQAEDNGLLSESLWRIRSYDELARYLTLCCNGSWFLSILKLFGWLLWTEYRQLINYTSNLSVISAMSICSSNKYLLALFHHMANNSFLLRIIYIILN